MGMQTQMLQNIQIFQREVSRSPTTSASQPSDPYRGSFVKCVYRFSGPDDVGAFLDVINTYKECVGISEANAIRGFLMLVTGNAAIWWQGIKETVHRWDDLIFLLHGVYGPRKPNFAIFRELFSEEQDEKTLTEFFVHKARALLSRLTEKPSEKLQIDMIYGLLHRKIRKRLPRDEVQNFEDLVKRARIIE